MLLTHREPHVVDELCIETRRDLQPRGGRAIRGRAAESAAGQWVMWQVGDVSAATCLLRKWFGQGSLTGGMNMSWHAPTLRHGTRPGGPRRLTVGSLRESVAKEAQLGRQGPVLPAQSGSDCTTRLSAGGHPSAASAVRVAPEAEGFVSCSTASFRLPAWQSGCAVQLLTPPLQPAHGRSLHQTPSMGPTPYRLTGHAKCLLKEVRNGPKTTRVSQPTQGGEFHKKQFLN